ncbi:ATP-dependent DNA helicase DinG [Bacillus carboniphilus]|uniref:ATP-dependent DNA helicase DinG n=1 Tax=Bacillus carboniphilus TaxID=86663 RepID=A0ABN0WVQ9_9BACI
MNRFVVVDLETTGNKAKEDDRIIQIGAVLLEDGKITNTYSTFVQPKRSIPSFISELTGITSQVVKDAPLFKDAVQPLIEMCKGASIVAHNSSFDLTFLQEEYRRNGLPIYYGNVIDTVELARFLFPSVSSYSLQNLASDLDITHSSPHRADADAEVTAKIFQKMLHKLQSLPVETLEYLTTLSFHLKSDIQLLLQHTKQQALNDNGRSDSFIVYNGVWIRPFELQNRTNIIDIDCKDKKWPEQVTTITDAWNQNKQYFYESHEAAPFFVNSLAYKVQSTYSEPLWIITNDSNKWIEFLNSKQDTKNLMIGTLKGRHYYLSLKKFALSLREQDTNYDHVLTKMQILVWLLETTTGLVDELNLSSSSKDFWIKIAADSRELTSIEDANYSYYRRALAEASIADILITNYALFLSKSLYSSDHVLKPNYCLLDEPEALIDLLPKFFGKKLTFVSFRIWLRQLETNKEKHFLAYIMQNHPNARNFDLSLKEYVEKLKESSEDFFQLAADYALLHEESVGGFSPYVTAPLQPSHTFDTLMYAGERFLHSMKDVVSFLTNNIQKATGTTLTETSAQVLSEWDLFQQDAEEMILTLQSFISNHQKDITRWVETDTRGMSHYTAIVSRPLLASNQFGDFLKERNIHSVFFSSSLTVNRSFIFSARSFGMTMKEVQGFRKVEGKRNQVLVGENVYSPKEVAELARELREKFDKIFILTSSFDESQLVTEAIQNTEDLVGYVLLSQSQASIGRLLKQMNRFDKAIYVGSQFSTHYTSGLEESEAFIITKLPFLSPQDLFHKLHSQKCEQEGRNSFYSFSLPYAVIRFKRLLARINFPNNKIYVLDPRIWKSEYGKTFIQSADSVEWLPFKNDSK